MWPDRVSNPGPLTYESGALPTVLRGLAKVMLTNPRTVWVFFSVTLYDSACLYICTYGRATLGKIMVFLSRNVSRYRLI